MITLHLATDRYDLLQPLVDGRVRAEDLAIELAVSSQQEQRNSTMARGDPSLDGAEVGLVPYLIMREQGSPVVGLPIFLRRMFGHKFFFVNSGSGITAPEQLVGRRVGIQRHRNTLAVWARGMLQEEHHIDPRQITWVVPKEEESFFSSGRALGLPTEYAEGPLTDLLVSGSIDALVVPHTIGPIDQGDSRVRRLFPDFKVTEQAYFRRTGDFPIMHLLALRREIVERNPQAVSALWRALERAKQEAYADLATPPRLSLAWARSAWEEERGILGADPWAFGVGPSRQSLDRLLRYTHAQGLTAQPIEAATVFYEPPDVSVPPGRMWDP